MTSITQPAVGGTSPVWSYTYNSAGDVLTETDPLSHVTTYTYDSMGRLLTDKKPDVLICGHSHILRVKKDPKYNLLYINPGAAGNQGFHAMRTLIRMEIAGGKVGKMEVIELGKRGELI